MVRIVLLVAMGLVLCGNDSLSAQSATAVRLQAVVEAKAQLHQLRNQLARLVAEVDDNASKQKELRAERNDLLGQQQAKGISSDSFTSIIKMLQLQRVELTIDLAGLEARREMMLQVQGESQGQEKLEVIQYLEAAIKQAEANAERARSLFESGLVPETKLELAESNLLKAKIQLAEAKESESGGGWLQDELLAISLDRSEKQARLKMTQQLLTEISNSRAGIEKNSLTRSRDFSSQRQNPAARGSAI